MRILLAIYTWLWTVFFRLHLWRLQPRRRPKTLTAGTVMVLSKDGLYRPYNGKNRPSEGVVGVLACDADEGRQSVPVVSGGAMWEL